jgi:hypothetical protein
MLCFYSDARFRCDLVIKDGVVTAFGFWDERGKDGMLFSMHIWWFQDEILVAKMFAK